MDNTIIASIIGVAGGLIGAWIGGTISRKASTEAVQSSNRNALDIMQRQEFNTAAAEFRIAFTEEQRLLDPNSLTNSASAGSASIIIKNAIDKHEVAMMKFEPFISKGSIEDYKKKWHEYAGNSQHFEQYTGDTALKKEEGRKLALSRINVLLKFAEPKHSVTSMNKKPHNHRWSRRAAQLLRSAEKQMPNVGKMTKEDF